MRGMHFPQEDKMNKVLLLGPSLLGLAVSMSGTALSPGVHPGGDRPLLSPSEMKATRGGSQGGVCSVASCRRPNGELVCTPVGGDSIQKSYNQGWDCSGGAGGCSATPDVWCVVSKYYHNTNCSAPSYYETTSYQDKCC